MILCLSCLGMWLILVGMCVVHTGEEDEETVYQVRGKLFALSPQNQWKEKGTGQLKLNVRREDGTGARLGGWFCFKERVLCANYCRVLAVMRKEAVYTLLLNATLFKGMRCTLAQDPRYIRFTVFENGTPTTYNLRVSCILLVVTMTSPAHC